MIVIDHIESLELNNDEESKYFNDLHSLQYLSQGLWFLYNQVHKIEAKIAEDIGKDKKVLMYGNVPELKEISQSLVACAFHWYAVSVCNYVKLVGWLAYNNDSTQASKYMKRVLPQVYLWRNKVAAHFARINPRKEDNAADLAKSVMFPISFNDEAYYSNSFILTQSSGGKSSTSRKDMRWSLTHTHSSLIPRYWPSEQTT